MLRGTFSTSRATTGPIFGHFMAPIDPKQPYLALSSFSSPKWVEYWVNMIEHCISHPRGSVRALSAPENVNLGPQNRPKVVLFGLKWPYLAIGSPSSPKWVEYWVNMVVHCISHPGGSVRALSVPRKCQFGAPEPPKKVFLGVAETAYGQIQPLWGHFGGFQGPPMTFLCGLKGPN